MRHIKSTYTTASGETYPLDFFFYEGYDVSLVYQPDIVREWCRDGCSNYGRGGGCPPRAPLFESIINPGQKIVIFALRFDSIYKPNNVAKSKNIAIHWKFQDGILARTLNNLGHSLVQKYGGRFLATGYCMGCPGKKCSFKVNETVCRNPAKRTFSMEATGINVVETVQRNLNIPMYWYRKGCTSVPYMLKVILWLPPVDVEYKVSFDKIVEVISNLKAIAVLKED